MKAKLNPEQLAEKYCKKYKNQMRLLESSSPLSRVRSIEVHDVVALGEQLDAFQEYVAFCEAEGTAADLGTLPNIALDVITTVYGASVLSMVASTQPIEDEKGTIWYRKVMADNTRGNVTANDALAKAQEVPDVYPVGYAAERQAATGIPIVNTDATDTYTGTLAGVAVPIRPHSVAVTVSVAATAAQLVKDWAASIVAADDGKGNLLGVGIQGTINYETGDYTFEILDDSAIPVVADAALVNYQVGTDFEAGAEVPAISTELDSIGVAAEVFALRQKLGLLKAFSLKKRFGSSAEDEIAGELTNAILGELGNTAIERLLTAYKGLGRADVEWSREAPSGVPWYLHKQELKDKFSEVEKGILDASGRGTVSYILADSNACSQFANLPGWQGKQIDVPGPQVYGTLDAKPVIRVPQGLGNPATGVNTKAVYGGALCIYRGTGRFDAPLSWSPYMPLFVSGTIPMDVVDHKTNLLMQQRVAAVWGAMQANTPQFCQRLLITD